MHILCRQTLIIYCRFLEVLEVGCIPVILANDWDLPFSEVIDWNRAAVIADERILTALPDVLRSITDTQIIRMREQVRFLWASYFRSFQTILKVTLEVSCLFTELAYGQLVLLFNLHHMFCWTIKN